MNLVTIMVVLIIIIIIIMYFLSRQNERGLSAPFPLFLLHPCGAVNPSDGHFGVGCDVYEVRPTPHSATIKPLQTPHTSAEEHSIGS